MSADATYSGDPSDSSRDAVRFLIGDTVDPFNLNDAEVDFILVENSSNIYKAGAEGARSVASKLGSKADKSVGDLSIRYAERRDHFLELADSLWNRSKVSRALTGVTAGGGADRDPQFWVGMQRYPGTPITLYSTSITEVTT